MKKRLTIFFFFSSFVLSAQHYFGVRINNRWGLIDQNGTLVVKPASEYFKPYALGPGRYVIFDTIENVDYLYHGLKKVRPINEDSIPYSAKDGPGYVRGKGYTDQYGRIIIKDTFRNSYPFREGLAKIVVRGKYDYSWSDVAGFIDTKGKIVIPCVYDALDIDDYFKDGVVQYSETGMNVGYINRKGDTLAPFIYTFQSRYFSEGRAAVEKDDKWNFIDTKGKLVSPVWFKDVHDFSEGLSCVEDTLGNIYYIDQQAHKVLAPDTAVFSRIHYGYGPFTEGLACVLLKNDTYGFINKKGVLVIPAKYNGAEDFSEGFAKVCDSTGCFFIDKTGKQLTRQRFPDADRFENGLARVYVGNDTGHLATGCVVMGTSDRFSNGEAYSRDLKMGYINRLGKMVWKPTR